MGARILKPWSPAEIEQLKTLYPDHSNKDIAIALGRPERAIKSAGQTHKLRKSESYAANAARMGRFGAGRKPWNAGLKGLDIGGKATRFGKGNKPHTWQPIGAERITEDGYRWRKVKDGHPSYKNWVPVHTLLWIEHHGAIPKGHVVVFRNRDKSDIRLDNLEMITRTELMARNTIQNYPPELKQVMRLKAAVTRKITLKEQGHGQND